MAALLREIVGDPWRPAWVLARDRTRLTLKYDTVTLEIAQPGDPINATVAELRDDDLMAVHPAECPSE